jgi:hypothetical protein
MGQHPITHYKTLMNPLQSPQNERDPQSQLRLGAPSSTCLSKSKIGANLTNVSSKLGQGPTPPKQFV